MKQTLVVLLCLAFLVGNLSAQKVWSLEKCIQHAKANNLNLKQAEINIRQAELDKKAAKYARLPRLNGLIDGGFNFGRTIDPTTNDFRNQRVGFNAFGIQTNAIVYNGGRNINTIKQSQFNIAAARAESEDYQLQLTLDITAAYLDILLAKEQVHIAQQQVEQIKEQLVYVDRQIKAGAIPENDRLEIIAQITRNKQTLVNAQNALATNYLRLQDLMELSPDLAFQIQVPKTTSNGVQNVLNLSNIYTKALNSQPAVKAAALRMESAALNLPIAKAEMLPSVAFSASLNSSYSNVSDFSDTPYFNQVGNNLGQSVSIRVSVPIYNNHQTQINIERARLEMINAEVRQRQVQQQLKSTIQNAIANADGAKIALDATQAALVAAKASFQNAQKKHQLGAINTLEYTTTKTNLDTAELDVVRAKYDYLFRLKIIDVYAGQGF